MRKRPLRNDAERAFEEMLTAEGWEVTKRGWPDFTCFRDDELILVEVKTDKNHHLLRSQYRLMKALTERGVTCYRWAPDTGFQRIF